MLKVYSKKASKWFVGRCVGVDDETDELEIFYRTGYGSKTHKSEKFHRFSDEIRPLDIPEVFFFQQSVTGSEFFISSREFHVTVEVFWRRLSRRNVLMVKSLRVMFVLMKIFANILYGIVKRVNKESILLETIRSTGTPVKNVLSKHNNV